jgi:hypothetical protein
MAQAPDQHAQAVAQAVAAANQVEQSRLPVYFGDATKDVFDAQTWINRVNNAAAAANWNDDNKLRFAYAALRGDALDWYTVMLDVPGTACNTWAGFQRAFLQAFSKFRTTRLATAVFDGLKQKNSENTVQFFKRVGKAFEDLKLIRPAPTPLDPLFPAAWAGQQWNNIADDAKQAAYDAILNAGLNHAHQCNAAQYYVAGLRPEIRDKLIFHPPAEGFVNMWRSCQAALEVEKNMQEPNKGTAAAIEAEEIEEGDIQALRYQRRGGFRGRFRGQHRGRGYNNSQNRSYSQGNKPQKFDGECNYCHKKGHMKKDCWTLNGKPKKISGLDDDDTNGDKNYQGQGHPFLEGQRFDDNQSYVGTLDYLN